MAKRSSKGRVRGGRLALPSLLPPSTRLTKHERTTFPNLTAQVLSNPVGMQNVIRTIKEHSTQPLTSKQQKGASLPVIKAPLKIYDPRRLHPVCIARQIRSQVLFAANVAGKSGISLGKHKRRNLSTEKVRC